MNTPTTKPLAADPTSAEPDAVWFLEHPDGSWVKKRRVPIAEQDVIFTRDPNEAERWPTEHSAHSVLCTATSDPVWRALRPTEHLFTTSLSAEGQPGGVECSYCSDGKRTGLPESACENCMNTGLANPGLSVEANLSEPASSGLREENERLKADVEALLAKLPGKEVKGWSLQSSLYEGYSTEIWCDAAEPGRRSIAQVRLYADAVKIMAALSTPKEDAPEGARWRPEVIAGLERAEALIAGTGRYEETVAIRTAIAELRTRHPEPPAPPSISTNAGSGE